MTQPLQQRQTRGYQLRYLSAGQYAFFYTEALTGGIGKSPDASNKDEQVLNWLRLVYKCQGAHNEKCACAYNDGSEDHVPTAEPVCHENETDGSEKLDGA